MLILVTGATGKVGRHFIARLLADQTRVDARIRALCHNRRMQETDRIEVAVGSIAERDVCVRKTQDTFQRQQDLFNQKVITAEEYDTAVDTFHENQATLVADEASVDRLEALEAFKVIRAPFDGILTARNIDIGAYVAAGSGKQLFSVARISPLRVYIDVPQVVAQLVKLGAEGDLSLSEFPGRTFPGQVTNTAVAINPVSRALLVELQTPNESGELFPGAYAQVTLKLTGETGFSTIPANALLFRAEGAAVGVVHPDGKVEIRKITVNLNQGDTLQVSGGLSETDQVIVNPSDSLADGMMVNVLRSK